MDQQRDPLHLLKRGRPLLVIGATASARPAGGRRLGIRYGHCAWIRVVGPARLDLESGCLIGHRTFCVTTSSFREAWGLCGFS